MASIIKAGGTEQSPVVFNFEDMAQQASAYIDQVRRQAQKEAVSIRQQAESAAQKSAREQLDKLVEQRVSERLESVLPVLKSAAVQLEQERHRFLSHWEQNILDLAIAIASRVIRRELDSKPEITLTLLREAIELAKGNPELTVYMNPQDQAALGAQAAKVIGELSRAMPAEIQADPAITRGGCRLETRFGSIDQRIETQLERIREELT